MGKKFPPWAHFNPTMCLFITWFILLFFAHLCQEFSFNLTKFLKRKLKLIMLDQKRAGYKYIAADHPIYPRERGI
jgi:hypothetical protein